MNSNHLKAIQKIIPKSTWSKKINLEDSVGARLVKLLGIIVISCR